MTLNRFFRWIGLLLLILSVSGYRNVPALAGEGGLTLTVNSSGDGADLNAGDGLCDSGAGACTLRAAIQEINAAIGIAAVPIIHNILFNIPGDGIRVISPGSALPSVNSSAILDAASQPGCSAPCIALSGAALPAGTWNGLTLNNNDGMVRGLIITSFSGNGILIVGSGNKIEGNRIGIWPGNPALLPNGTGINILGSFNTVGGTSPSQRNVISGNDLYGVAVANGASPSTTGNIIQGNFIGLNIPGTAKRGNGGPGISVFAPANGTVIGGTDAGMRNVISGNAWSGIEVKGVGTIIQGNFIGTKASGRGSIGNGLDGIRVFGTAVNTTIGGPTNAAKNRITHNDMRGISVASEYMPPTRIQRNSIFSNGDLGIDLGADGYTPNDELDSDIGVNGLQNFPIINYANSTTLLIKGVLRSKAEAAYVLEFFWSPGCDTSGKGEGKNFLGTKTVTTSATGSVAFKLTSPRTFPAGSRITATATDGNGATSEFSRCRVAD